MSDVLANLKLNVEIVFHFLAFVIGVGVLAFLCVQAKIFNGNSETFFTASTALQAGFILCLVLYMVVNIFRNQAFIISNPKVGSLEVIMIILLILLFVVVFIALRMTVFKNIDMIDQSALTLIDSVQNMVPDYTFQIDQSNNVQDTRALTDVVQIQSKQGDKGAFSLCMWIGLDPKTLPSVYTALANSGAAGLLSEDTSTYRVKIPIFIRGIPKQWYVQNGLNPELQYYNNSVALVKCPLIWLVLSVDANKKQPIPPYFEIEFNHMEDRQRDVVMNVPNSCYIQDTYTAKCTFLENSIDMDIHDQLKLGNNTDPNAMHFVSFVFQETYLNSSISSLQQELYTQATIFIDDGTSKQDSYFQGQMLLSSAKVKVLPAELMDIQYAVDNNVKTAVQSFLAASKIGKVTYYSYPLAASDVSAKFDSGIDTTVSTANNSASIDASAAQNMPGNTDRSVVTFM